MIRYVDFSRNSHGFRFLSIESNQPFRCPVNEFGKALDEGKEIRVVFCDISKAFDRVWHIGLLKKIESIGIQGPLLSWIKNYLSDRKQRVVINNSNSQWRDIKAGGPRAQYWVLSYL
jgi:hypothetical protein